MVPWLLIRLAASVLPGILLVLNLGLLALPQIWFYSSNCEAWLADGLQAPGGRVTPLPASLPGWTSGRAHVGEEWTAGEVQLA